MDCEEGALRVYGGEALVDRASGTFTVKGGKYVTLESKVLTAASFDSKVGDEFYRWAARRASYLSMVNVASAKEAHDAGLSASAGQWVFNPWYNMFTYLPYRSWYNSPFGYGFWSAGAWPGYGGGYYGYPGYYNGGSWGGWRWRRGFRQHPHECVEYVGRRQPSERRWMERRWFHGGSVGGGGMSSGGAASMGGGRSGGGWRWCVKRSGRAAGAWRRHSRPLTHHHGFTSARSWASRVSLRSMPPP